MLDVLADRTYRHLFLAQVIALVGTGLATIALGLLAFDLAGASAGAVLGTALAIKMIAYIGVAPIAAVLADRWPRRTMLVVLDLVRAAVALALPFVSEIWHVYVLIFVLQSASAGFTPTFQATIPDVLPDERAYTRALSLSRLAYDLESVASPMLAAALLTIVDFHALFGGTSIGFVASALLVASVALPRPARTKPRPILARVLRGVRIYLATPRLRGLLALNLAVAAASAMVIVNTVVIVQSDFDLGERATAMALAAFGLGSMLVAFALPRLLERVADRAAMLFGGGVLVAGLVAGLAVNRYAALLALWAVLGAAYAVAQTPSGRLLRRSSTPEDRPALFAAQFSLSHACWLVAYPIAGLVGSSWGRSAAFGVLAVVGGLALVAAHRLWPRHDPERVAHRHDDLPPDHPHLAGVNADDGRHEHAFTIDDLHRHWPPESGPTATRKDAHG